MSVIVVFFHRTGAVGGQQLHQIVHLTLEHPSLVGFRHFHTVFQPLEDQRIVGNVVIVVDGIVAPGEGLVGNDAEVPGTENQRVAGDAEVDW